MNNLHGYELAFTEIVLASNIGINGNLFGGQMMAWLDKAASLYVSSKINSQNIVTAKFGELNFLEKVKEKEIIRIYAKLTRVGKSSITIDLKACKVVYNEYQEQLVDVVHTSAVFVHIDKEGKSKQLPKIIERNIFCELTTSQFHPLTCCSAGSEKNCQRRNGTGEGELIHKESHMECPCGEYKQYYDGTNNIPR